ncbi:MAG: SixA phosphatase family protein [Bacteroidota bacterium]
MDNERVTQNNFSHKTVFFLRHSDAENIISGQNDFQRELNSIGKQKVTNFTTNFSSEFQFDLVLCSTSVRTRQTLDLLDLKCIDFVFCDSLYLTEKERILSEIQQVSEKINKLLVIGHNNGISDLASYITKTGILLSTCQMVEIRLESPNWELVEQGMGTIVRNFF